MTLHESELGDDIHADVWDMDSEPEPEPRKPHLSDSQRRDLRRRIEDPISKIADWIAGRDEELAEILKQDAPKMAAMLSKLAANAHTPMIVVLIVQAFASLLEPIDAFGRTIIHLLKRIRETRVNRQHLQDVTPEDEAEEIPQPPPPALDDHVARPWDLSQ